MCGIKLAPVLLLWACSGWATEAMDDAGWVSFTLSKGHILFPITLNGVHAEAVLDSGAETNGIGQHFVDEHEADLHFGDVARVQSIFGVEMKQLVDGVKVGMSIRSLQSTALCP